MVSLATSAELLLRLKTMAVSRFFFMLINASLWKWKSFGSTFRSHSRNRGLKSAGPSTLSINFSGLLICRQIFFFLMIRQPPRSTLFPTRRSSDLCLCYDCKIREVWAIGCNRTSGRNLYNLIAGAKVVVQELQYPQTGVRFSVVPVHHGYAGELRGVADQLRFSRDINAQSCELRKNVGILGAC